MRDFNRFLQATILTGHIDSTIPVLGNHLLQELYGFASFHVELSAHTRSMNWDILPLSPPTLATRAFAFPELQHEEVGRIRMPDRKGMA